MKEHLMHEEHIFSSVVFGKWRQEARALKRSSELSHHQALEQVAKEHRFASWRHVVTEAKLNRISESAYRTGLVVAYDIKDAMDNWNPDESFADDSRVLHFCEGDIFEWYRRTDDEAEGEERDAIPSDPAGYLEDFEEWLNNVHLFRYTGAALPPTPTKVLPLLRRRCFFAPLFFWYRGRFVDPWRDLAVNDVLDMSGNTEPINE
jgi:hypothetical protein